MKTKLTAWEKRLRDSVERGEWESLGEKARKSFASAARKQVKQERVNIRLSSDVLGRIRLSAIKRGIPYQTLIASVLHSYSTGRLVDEESVLEAVKLLKRAA